MNDAAWERLVDAIDVSVGVDRHGRTKGTAPDRPDLATTTEFIEFSKGDTEYRLERVTSPAIVDRKTHYSHRPGVANRVEYIYDTHETMHKVTLYRQQAGSWQEQALDQLGL